jgi:tRNA-dihydrouridine synthase A
MIDWTDRHCRFFHRLLAPRALLYSEMVVADAVIHGDRRRLLGFDGREHPVALQLGGSDPAKLAEAARIAEEYGYDEVNLNVGCPSDRVKSGTFGACLMLVPDRVAACVEAMKQAVGIPVTVKCRLGVDEQDPETALDAMADGVFAAGADGLWVHARKAWLQGLSPKENREIPPLDYQRVYRLKERLPNRFIGINGGIQKPDEFSTHLAHVDGVMLGRAAYQDPYILAEVDQRLFGASEPAPSRLGVLDRFMAYAEGELARGVRLNQMTRHILGLFHGQPRARSFRRVLAENAHLDGAGLDVLKAARDVAAGTSRHAVAAE